MEFVFASMVDLPALTDVLGEKWPAGTGLAHNAFDVNIKYPS
jgi:hypothetical protein